MKKKKVNSIRKQILSGYRHVILVMCLLVVVSLVSLIQISRDYRTVSSNRNNQAATQSALAKHYEWLEMFNQSILNGTEFEGSLDYNTCLLVFGNLNMNRPQPQGFAEIFEICLWKEEVDGLCPI